MSGGHFSQKLFETSLLVDGKSNFNKIDLSKIVSGETLTFRHLEHNEEENVLENLPNFIWTS